MKLKKKNFLIYAGAGILFCTSILYIFLISSYPYLIKSPNKIGNFDNVILIILSTLLIAPILEDIIFRGIFTNKKIYVYCFYIGSLLLIVVTKNYYLSVLLLLFYLQSRYFPHVNIQYFMVSVLFALIHYSVSDIDSIFSVVPIFFQFSIGLILIWITINFGLRWSMLIHFFINFSIITPLIIVLQTPDKVTKQIEYNSSKLIWQKNTLIGESKFSYTSKKVSAERMTIEQFTNLIGRKESQKVNVNDSLKYYRYNFILEKGNENQDFNDIKQLLIKSQLIEP